MRRSSSTTSRCGASSAGCGRGPRPSFPRWVRTAAVALALPRARISFCTLSRIVASIIATRNRRAASCAFGSDLAERAAIRSVCRPASFVDQCLALRRDEKQALAAVVLARLLHDIALVDQLLEHPAERLLGDLQHLQQIGDLHARMAVDEMQHPVVRPAEAELRQHIVGIADEIAVGEEQQLDDIPAGDCRPGIGRVGPVCAFGRGQLEKFMSAMLTYFGFIVTKRPPRRK